MSLNLNIPPEAWLRLLNAEQQQQLNTVLQSVAAEDAKGIEVFPPQGQRFTALNVINPDQVKVVILGQDPYPTPGNAHGLAFSVIPGTKIPASLRNMFKEIESDIGRPSLCAGTGNLLPWAEQGVLLLNTTLTVQSGAAGSHEKLGWQAITLAWLQALVQINPKIVFLLWGSHAQKLKAFLHQEARCLLSVHPSPLSAYRGFFGCRHFSQVNALLQDEGKAIINW